MFWRKQRKPKVSKKALKSAKALKDLGFHIPIETPKRKYPPVLRPFVWTERRLENVLAWLRRLALLEILAIISNVGILFAIVTYAATEKQRRDEVVFTAWQTITNAEGQPGSGGRIKALEFLNASPGANWRRRAICLWLCTWEPESLAGIGLSVSEEKAGVYLEGIVLTDADLEGANLTNANLRGANLNGANLGAADLTNAKLRNANLNGAYLFRANLTNANLRGANLRGANLSGANLTNASLTPLFIPTPVGEDIFSTKLQTSLAGANLTNANLSSAKLWGADLTDAQFFGTNLTNANLRGANLRGAILTSLSVFVNSPYDEDMVLTEMPISLVGANFTDVDLTGASLGSVNFTDAVVCQTVFPKKIDIDPNRDCPE